MPKALLPKRRWSEYQHYKKEDEKDSIFNKKCELEDVESIKTMSTSSHLFYDNQSKMSESSENKGLCIGTANMPVKFENIPKSSLVGTDINNNEQFSIASAYRDEIHNKVESYSSKTHLPTIHGAEDKNFNHPVPALTKADRTWQSFASDVTQCSLSCNIGTVNSTTDHRSNQTDNDVMRTDGHAQWGNPIHDRFSSVTNIPGSISTNPVHSSTVLLHGIPTTPHISNFQGDHLTRTFPGDTQQAGVSRGQVVVTNRQSPGYDQVNSVANFPGVKYHSGESISNAKMVSDFNFTFLFKICLSFH